MNCVLLSVMMTLGTPNRWILSVKNMTACSEQMLVMGRASIHGELVNGYQQVRVPSCRPLEWSHEVEAPDCE